MVNKDKKRVLKYSIKKFSVGTFSVLVGAFIFLASPALANEANNSENIHKENNTIIEKEKPKEIYKSEVNVTNETRDMEKVASRDTKENNSPKKKSNLVEEKNPIDVAVLESREKNDSIEKNGESIEEKSSIEKAVAEKPKARRKRSTDSERESVKRFATDDDFVKISKGLITTEDGRIDNLLFGKTPLKANEDKDGDSAKNGSEIYVYEKDGKTYYEYYGHPFLKDTDGDGIVDHDQSDLSKPGDDDNFKWYVTDRDMAMFMKLVYRDDEYIKKVLNKDYTWTKADNIVKDDPNARNVYELIHNEFSPYWEIDKTYHNASGLDAVLFKTKSTLPILPDGLVHVLAIRGTKGSADVTNDGVITAGQDPQQGKEIEEIIKEIGIREDIKNFYITGHSLGGYLTQRAVVKLNRLANEENGNWIDSTATKYRNFYNNVFKKATTFNAPKINASRINGDLYKKSILSKQLAKQGKIKHYGMRGDRFVGLLYNDKDVMTYIEGGEHSSNAYFSAMLNDNDNFNIGERTGVSGKGKENLILKNLKIVEPTDEEVRKIVNENIKISLKDQNPVEILALNKISREEVLKKLNLDNLPNTATLNINIPDEIQPTAVNYVLPVTISYLGKTVNPNINVVVKVLPNFEELKAIKQKASDEKEKKVDTEHKTAETKNRYDAKKVELDTKLQKVEELLKNSSAKQSDIKVLTKELEILLEEYKMSVSGLKLDKTLLTDEIAKATNKLEMFKNTDTSLKPVEVVTEFSSRKDELLNNYSNRLREVQANLERIETYDKLVEEKNKLANFEKEIQEASSILNKTQKDYYEPIKKSYELYEGDKPNAELSIEKSNIPIKNIIWEIKPNTSSSGNKEGRVKVVYNDESFDLVDVNVNVKALYGEIVTTTKEEKIPLKVTYIGDETKDYGYISEIAGEDGKVVTTIKSRLNKKTNNIEEISRTSVRTEAKNTVITKGLKSKIEEIKIPREVVYEEEASLDKGKEFVKIEGEDGKNITITTYILNSTTGEVIEKITVENKEKIDKIIVRGTKEEKSSVPEKQEKPVQPEASGKQGDSTQPSTPVKPEAKEEQGDSAQPSTPTTPAEEKQKEEKPSVPEKQEKPVQPEASGKQGDSAQPLTPTTPAEEKPKEETPKVSEKQEKPVQPENSGKEGTSVSPAEEKPKEEKPSVPEKQEKPVQPEASGKQGDSAQPLTPTTPAEEKPKEETPKVSEKQEKPVQPENSGKEGTSVSPAEEKPKEEKPSVPEKQEKPVQPEVLGKQGDSAQPSTPVKPEAKEEQGDSAQPSTPTNPAEEKPKEEKPSVPEKQEKPVQSENSGKEGTSVSPAEEKQKEEKPSVPEKQEKPVQPEASGKQGDSAQPLTPTTPAEEKPKEETPKVSEKQEKPVQPENSGKEGTSVSPAEEKPKEEKPSVPEKQEKPVQPEASGKEGQPVQPGTPAEPEASGKQGDSTQPSTPVKPEAKEEQGGSAQPSTPTNPAEEKPKEEIPEASGKEEQPVQPGTPAEPEASGKQGDSTQPSTPVKPEAKEEQGGSAQPSTPTNPDEEKQKEETPKVSGKQGDSAQPSTPTNPAEEKQKEETPKVSDKQENPVQPENSGKEGTSITSSEGKEETSHVSDNSPVLTRKIKTLFLESLDKKVSLELYDVSIDDIEFRAVEIEDEKEINAVKDKLQGNKNVRIYDLSLHKGEKEISLNNNRLVRVALAEYENKNIEVYRVEKNGNIKQIPSVINNGNVEFYIDHFSQFAIVSDKNNLSETDTKNAIFKENSLKQQSLPKTGMSNTNDFSLLAIISLLVLVLSRKQKDSMK